MPSVSKNQAFGSKARAGARADAVCDISFVFVCVYLNPCVFSLRGENESE